ncbi:hypothetical protein PoB_000892200 [Plakobranchus ocellatus]|uniref:Uncharacterized protein n=1 Tax=Plakobranchus ocellatus TaxID=259542 RepID=A0AAV3YJN7_9GAST|nr:hypothetical protein PoB_000892200 [Plakobranchus ocellatus]
MLAHLRPWAQEVCSICKVSRGEMETCRAPEERQFSIGDAVLIPMKLSHQDPDIDNATETIIRQFTLPKCFFEHWKMRINMTKTGYTTYSPNDPMLKKYLDIRIREEFLKAVFRSFLTCR